MVRNSREVKKIHQHRGTRVLVRPLEKGCLVWKELASWIVVIPGGTVLATIVELGKGRLGYKEFGKLTGFLWNMLLGNWDGMSRIIWKLGFFELGSGSNLASFSRMRSSNRDSLWAILCRCFRKLVKSLSCFVMAT